MCLYTWNVSGIYAMHKIPFSLFVGDNRYGDNVPVNPYSLPV